MDKEKEVTIYFSHDSVKLMRNSYYTYITVDYENYYNNHKQFSVLSDHAYITNKDTTKIYATRAIVTKKELEMLLSTDIEIVNLGYKLIEHKIERK